MIPIAPADPSKAVFFPHKLCTIKAQNKGGSLLLILLTWLKILFNFYQLSDFFTKASFASWKIYILWNISLVISPSPWLCWSVPGREPQSLPHRQGHTAPKWLLWKNRELWLENSFKPNRFSLTAMRPVL